MKAFLKRQPETQRAALKWPNTHSNSARTGRNWPNWLRAFRKLAESGRKLAELAENWPNLAELADNWPKKQGPHKQQQHRGNTGAVQASASERGDRERKRKRAYRRAR